MNYLKPINKKYFFYAIYIFLILLIITFLSNPRVIFRVSSIDNFFQDLGFSLQKVEISGNQNLSKLDILKNINYKNCLNLLCLDLQKTKIKIENIGWVKNVNLKLNLPNELIIKINEEYPYFILKNEGDFYLLNKDGNKIVTLNKIEKEYHKLTILSGKNVISNLNELLAIFSASPDLAKKIKKVNYISDRRWSFVHLLNIMIELPENNPEAAFIKINELNEKYGFLSNKLEKVDLRVKDRMIIKLKTLGESKLNERKI